MLKVGLIGCGGMGTNHAMCYGALTDTVELAAVADLDPEKAKAAADRTGSRIYRTGEELIQNEALDVIDICLPTYLHAGHAVMAMEKGRHVFLEKPVCLNREEAGLLLETQKKTGALVQVGQVIRFWDEYVWTKNAKDSGEYGRLDSAVFTRLSANPKWAWENWFNDPERSGSVALDLHIHDVDYVRYLMGGEPDALESCATRDADGVIQHIFTTYRYGDKVLTAEGCWDYPDSYPFSMFFRVKFEKATVVLDREGFYVYPADGERFRPELNKRFERSEDIGINVSDLGAYYNELKYFTDRCISGEPLEIAPLCEAVRSLELDLKEIELAGGIKKQ